MIEGPIPFYSLCEHHSFPFFGHAFVGYIAHEHIIGITKLTRMVRLLSRRFTVQERFGQKIADLLVRLLQPHGVAVYLTATHLCTDARRARARIQDLDHLLARQLRGRFAAAGRIPVYRPARFKVSSGRAVGQRHLARPGSICVCSAT